MARADENAAVEEAVHPVQATFGHGTIGRAGYELCYDVRRSLRACRWPGYRL